MRKRKGLLVICDGLGDRPISSLNYQTPLEKASTPNLDKLSTMAMCGNVYPVAPGIRVGTDVGHLHIFGYDSKDVYTGRGPLEAASAGIEMQAGDIAFRGNFGTVNEEYTVLDRRAGRIRDGADVLAACLDDMVLSDGTRVFVKPLTEHRVAVVFRGLMLSDAIVETDPGTAREGSPLVRPSVKENTPAAKRTADLLWEFTERSYDILRRHPLNLERVEKGLAPANVIITRGVGKKAEMPSVYDRFKIKAACIAGDLTVVGIAKMAGMDGFTHESFTGSVDTNLKGKADLAIELLEEKGYDWVVLHVKATDILGHDNKPQEKVAMIEKIDGMIGYIKENLNLYSCYLTVTADHSTPCEVMDHTGDGVPTIIAGWDVRKDGIMKAGERFFKDGSLNKLTANDVFMLQMDLMGFTPKLGA